ncbi:MAG TPA: hypothetical protein VN745_02140 [Verrucomicrobiae bacterium]|nr:hypothetical protein [Verrucomicrobiae bacterium]
MRLMQKLPVLVLLLVFVAASSFAADELAIHLHFTAAKQDDPLQITGFKLPQSSESRPTSPQVLLHNTTGRAIESFYMRAIIGDPRGADGTEPKFVNTLGQESPRIQPPPQIAPYGDATFEATFLRPMNSAFDAKNFGRSCVQIAVAVTYVKFSDGGTWSIGWKDFQPLWADSIQPESLQGCTPSENTGIALQELKGFTIFLRPVTGLSSSPVKSYSVVCRTQSVNSDGTAVCDW